MQPTQPQLQEIIDRIGQVNNILITVKANPSVDELSAALGLTMALNNSGKHATAVFSGQIPNAMSFLKPQKIFENNVHSLRDFIISLNKEKADKLRFAKDGEIVKIYITPYKSTITSQDLEYSEGDFNVQMVIAIGINSKEELDTVIAAHGRILHEATVATIMPGPTPSQLGSVNWLDPSLSSSSAMVVQLLQSLNLASGISPEIATALLTGIVADTDRFSNAKTSPKIMELSALLMNAGADHQLVSSSIGAVIGQSQTLSSSATPNQATSLPPIGSPATLQEKEQELVLDLHSSSTPTVQTAPAQSSATNTEPMVSTKPAQLKTQPTAPSEVATPLSSNPILEKVLPKPQDAAQTVLPSDLLPPQNSSTPAPTPETLTSPTQTESVTQPEATEPAMSPVGATPAGEVDKIRSEIDQIFSAQPFDPANQPRQDLGTEIILPEEEKPEITDPVSPSSTIDTSVQQEQAINSLQPIQTTKNEEVSANDVLGLETPQISSIPPVPGLESPPEIALPPPPPAPAIETAPFGDPISFDPTKKAEQ
jgi:hypothetical protein